MKTKVFWSKVEQEAVFERMVQLFTETPFLRREQALERAQTVLPAERQRKAHYSVVYRYKDWIDEARSRAKSSSYGPPVAEPEPVQPVAHPKSLQTILDDLIELISARVAEKVLAGLQPPVLLNPPLVEPRPQHVPTPAAPVLKRTGVVVVGLLNQQANTIISTFTNLDITCLTTEEALKRPLLRRAHTVLMTKFLNHSVHNKYRKVPNLHSCNGGVSELSAILKNIA